MALKRFCLRYQGVFTDIMGEDHPIKEEWHPLLEDICEAWDMCERLRRPVPWKKAEWMIWEWIGPDWCDPSTDRKNPAHWIDAEGKVWCGDPQNYIQYTP